MGECLRAHAANASRPATTASIRASCSAWRGSRWRDSGMSRRERRRQGVDGFRKVARDVTHISQMQLDDELLARLGQKPGGNAEPDDAARFRVLHRLQRAQDPAHCAACARHHGCARRHLSGAWAVRAIAAASCRCAPATSPHRAASPRTPWTSLRAASRGRWCRGARAVTCNSPRRPCRRSRRPAARSPFEMTPFMLFLRGNLDRLRPLLRKPVRDARRLASPSRTQGRGRGRRGHPAAPCRASSWSTSSSPRSA